jgi:hypothetical protein
MKREGNTVMKEKVRWEEREKEERGKQETNECLLLLEVGKREE